jgi:hypothetical protein
MDAFYAASRGASAMFEKYLSSTDGPSATPCLVERLSGEVG